MAEIFGEVPPVDWPGVNEKLPTSQDPGSRATRKELFRNMNTGGGKALSLKEVQEGIAEELGYHIQATSLIPVVKELKLAVRAAFKVAKDLGPARKEKAKAKAKVDTGGGRRPSGGKAKKQVEGTVDQREFHAFLVAFKFYLELAEVFEYMDNQNEDDQMLSYRECMKGIDRLAVFGITEELLTEKFEGVDIWTPILKFDDFADWCLSNRCERLETKLDDSDDEEVQYEAAATAVKEKAVPLASMGKDAAVNKLQVQQIFEDWDADHNGGISAEEMMAVMLELNPAFTEKQVLALFARADADKNGFLDFEEFFTWLFKPGKNFTTADRHL